MQPSTPNDLRTTDHEPGATQVTVGFEPRSESAPTNVAVPGYEIEGVLGRGGMGVVYKARHLALKRVVALKMILAGGHAGERELARFRIEAEAVARLAHPNIVQVFEVGAVGGLPYCALEFIEGGSLAACLADKQMSPGAAARLVETLARAMHVAHARNVVHRDLKPANILLTADGVPKITDFGLARQLDADSRETQAGSVMGTPAYMAPEQAAGRAHEAGPAADIYALGAILYECLTGQPPFTGSTLVGILDQVRNQEPARPSGVPADLATICLKCLRKEPEQRYASALELAEELQRYQRDEPIRARPVGGLERAIKWVRRRPGIAALSAAVVLVALLGLGAFIWAYQVALTERGTALTQQGIAETKTQEAQAFAAAETRAKEETQRQLYKARLSGYAAHLLLAQFELGQKHYLEAELVLARCEPDLRHLEHRHLLGQARRCLHTLTGHAHPVQCVALSRDGKLLASGGGAQFEQAPGELKLWDAGTGRLRHTLQGHTDAIRSVAFAPDGLRLASAARDGTVKLWDTTAGTELHSLKGHAQAVMSVGYRPDGKQVASASLDGTVKIWDATTGTEIQTLQGFKDGAMSVCFSPAGDQLAVGCGDRTVRVWASDPARELHILQGHTRTVRCVCFSPDGKWLAAAADDKMVKVWDAPRGAVFGTITSPSAVSSLCFSPNSQRLAGALAGAGGEQVVQVWDATAGREVLTLKGHTGPVLGVAFGPDGTRLVSGAGDQTVKVWDATDATGYFTFQGHAAPVNRVCHSPDSRRVASASHDKTVKVWDSGDGREVLTLQGHENVVWGVCYSPDGSRLATASMDQTVRLWDATGGQHLRTLTGHTGSVQHVCFSPDGTRLASAARGNPLGRELREVKVWDPASGECLLTLKQHTGDVNGVAYSPDGKHLASASSDRTVRVWDAASGAELFTLKKHTGPVTSVCFTPDGTRLVSGSVDRTVQVWDAATGVPRFALQGHTAAVVGVCVSADGKRIVSVSGDRTVKLWDAVNGQELLTLSGHGAALTSASFSPDGTTLATASFDRTVRIWR